MHFPVHLRLLGGVALGLLVTTITTPLHGAGLRRTVLVAGGSSVSIPTESLSAQKAYGTLISLPVLAGLGEADRLEVTVSDAAGEACRKKLHAGDSDLYFTLRPRKDGKGGITITAGGAPGKTYELKVSVDPIVTEKENKVIFGTGPNQTWQTAQPIELGKTVFASNDERPYIPAADEHDSIFRDMLAGAQWYTFSYQGEEKKLAYFVVDLLDRDVPMDVNLFTREGEGKDARLVPYEDGIERYIIEPSTPFHGLNKFIARSLKKGTYYLRVMGNHPAYQLRTYLYDPPPYNKPDVPREQAAAKAIRASMDYLINKGDSWHANTPRRGSVVLRNTNALQETQLCIACHPTHFTTRTELVAVDNGWPVRQRHALKFLTERLYNNPRPLYGDPETAWVRVISAPGNVTSRLAWMEMEFEKHISHEQRQGIMPDLAHLLEKYWVDVKYTIDESAGTLPRESGFEIALHSRLVFEELYRRTGDAKYADFRWRCEKVLLDSKPLDLLDLCWKAVALATFDRGLYADEIRDTVEKIYSYQRPDGTWPMVFGDKILGYNYNEKKYTETPAPMDKDGKTVSSDFQTFHCIYALAVCGVTTADPRLAKAVDYCLSQQWSHGGWQGNTAYKNFDTTFRDTQYAVMALSQLYRGPGSDGWMAGFDKPPASVSADSSVDEFISAVDQYWEKPDVKVLEQVRQALNHTQPLVREAAAACLGRIADAESLPALAKQLGDPSKMVQRSAAWAIREIATRRNTGDEIILSALRSSDDRTRWGATQIFNQHFRYLAQNHELLKTMIERLQDPVVVVRMAAAQALPKWWFWLKDISQRERIEKALVDGLGRVEHPWVRRNLIEGFRNTQDDNGRYLYTTWIPGLKQPEDQKLVETTYNKKVADQAQRILQILEHGNNLQRDGILRSFYTFHLHESGGNIKLLDKVAVPESYMRSGPTPRGDNKWLEGYKGAATYDPLSMGSGVTARLGNDSDPLDYSGDPSPIIGRALLAMLDTGEGMYHLPLLKSLRHLRGITWDDGFSARVLRLAAHTPPEHAAEVRALLKELLPEKLASGEKTAGVMAELIAAGGEPLQVVSAILGKSRNGGLGVAPPVMVALSKTIADSPPENNDLLMLLNCASNVQKLHAEPAFVERIFVLAETAPPHAARAAARLMISSTKFLADREPRKKFERLLRNVDKDRMLLLLKVAGDTDYSRPEADLSVSLALGMVTTGLNHADTDVRVSAVETVRAIPKIQDNPAVVASVRELAGKQGTKANEFAKMLLASFDERNKQSGKAGGAELDFNYFLKHVQPILQTRGEDNNSCVGCHASHSILKLNEPDVDGKLTDARLRENYLSALRAVNLSKPEESLILRKPTSSFDGIGVPGNYLKTHGGDVRWKDAKNSDSYKTILKWIQGARESQ